MDHYQRLGVTRDASPDEIKKAFRRLARESHPDANPGDPMAEHRFREVATAYEVLSDPDKRARYNRGDTVDLGDLFGGGLEDLLASVFGESGFFGATTRAGARRRGRDILVVAEIGLVEAFEGVVTEVAFDGSLACEACHGRGAEAGTSPETCSACDGAGAVRMARSSMLGQIMTVGECQRCQGTGQVITRPCATCRGAGAVRGRRSLQVEVPAGVDSGTRLRLTGKGESPGRRGQPGDLYVEVHVIPDDRFSRTGVDLHHRVVVDIADAALGTTVEVPLIDGGSRSLDVPSGSQPGQVFMIRSKGMPRLGRRGRGDLVVTVDVVVPSRLDRRQRDALEAYRAATRA